jgi:hypothetical protein
MIWHHWQAEFEHNPKSTQREVMMHQLHLQMQGFQQTTPNNHPYPSCDQTET